VEGREGKEKEEERGGEGSEEGRERRRHGFGGWTPLGRGRGKREEGGMGRIPNV